MKAHKKISAVDLFCGVGGLSKGLQNAGIEVLAGFDDWPKAIDIYSLNLPHHAAVVDLLNVDEAIKLIKPFNSDIIVGGPPCQDFSSAGKRTEGNQATLTEAFAMIVAKCKPDYVLMENVPRARFSKAYRRGVKQLKQASYSISEHILDASYCNVPQIRKRFFMLGTRVNTDLHDRFRLWVNNAISDERLTVKDYMKNEITISHYYRHPRNYARRAVFSVNEPSPTIRGVNRPVPPNYQRNHLDSVSPSSVRPLTSEERSRIQTFPLSWKWCRVGEKCTKTETETMIGNAVPVNLARFVGAGILASIHA